MLRSGSQKVVPRILLAEDDEAMRQLLAETLAGRGYQVDEADNGAALATMLEDLLDEPSDPESTIVISDIYMPGFTGLDVLREMNDLGLRLPVILITAFGDARIHEEATRLGALGVLDKPFDLPELLALVESAALVRFPPDP